MGAMVCTPTATPRRSSRWLSVACGAAVAVAVLHVASMAFLPASPPTLRGDLTRIANGAGVAAATATLGGAAPVFADEGGLLNFGKVELGGGFAINLDIPETGIVNIVVLIGGLLYLLGPLLTNSMEARNKEIQQDIDDAIAKFGEAQARLAEAEKARAQADEVVAEIEASIAKDQEEFKATIEAQTQGTLDRQASASEQALKALEGGAEEKIEAYIAEQAISRGLREIVNSSDAQKAKFMQQAIDSL
eukprot:CAMPEP_0117567218 /NCGR_PEP_ID=MMETSP0784-20121206/57487_1 /TAXON_ID=39447 /ORGANISM="" /LENGTH=247 /DNA_ID=CAMNT_0005365069 /DNA_START=84 /DNA_END=827 /DNA_ORIENTATION=-